MPKNEKIGVIAMDPLRPPVDASSSGKAVVDAPRSCVLDRRDRRSLPRPRNAARTHWQRGAPFPSTLMRPSRLDIVVCGSHVSTRTLPIALTAVRKGS